MAKMLDKDNEGRRTDFLRIRELVGEQKFSEAMNELKKMIAADSENRKAQTLLEYLEKIVEYRNKDIFSSTNLDMDPWLE
jgi:formylmethanofuran dehydrogenase subunit E